MSGNYGVVNIVFLVRENDMVLVVFVDFFGRVNMEVDDYVRVVSYFLMFY